MLYKGIPKRTVNFCMRDFNDIVNLSLSGSVKEGEYINKFEDVFKSYIGSKEAVAVSSGRFALELILEGLGLRRGDKVVLSSFNFKGVPLSLINAGFIPVFVDADKQTFQMDINKIEEKIDGDTKAIIVTHLFGQPCSLKPIENLAKKHNLHIVEDCAHALGAFYGNGHVGVFGKAGFFSLTASKTINTSFGGVVVTNDTILAAKIRTRVSRNGFPDDGYVIKKRLMTYIYSLLTDRTFYSVTQHPLSALMALFGLDLWEVAKKRRPDKTTNIATRLCNLQASAGLRQIAMVEDVVSTRRRNARILVDNLDKSIRIQKVIPEAVPSYFMFPIIAENKALFYKKLLLGGVDTNSSYITDCSHLVENSFSPNARFLEDSILGIHLPFNLRKCEVLSLAEIINRAFRRHER